MLTETQVELLELMARHLETEWSSCESGEENDIADIFAKVTQSITQFDQSVDAWAANQYIFIQIGPDFINQSGRGDIIRAHILERNISTYDGKEIDPKRIKLTLRQIEGSECYSSYNVSSQYRYDSTEGQALLKWLTEHSEVLVPYNEPIEE